MTGRDRGSAVRTAVRTLGELLLTGGVIVLMFSAYELWGTGLYTAEQQTGLHQSLEQSWATSSPAPPTPGPTQTSPKPGEPTPTTGPSPSATETPPDPSVAIGSGLAILRIPHLGADFDKVIVEGVGVEDLKRGPGHYPGTAFPGQVGNFVVSGHRTTYGAPFNRIDELQVGDAILVETAKSWFVYRVTGSEVVSPDATDVISAVPHHPGQQPTTAVLTLTTCNPKYSASQRLIVYATLDSTTPASAGVPAAARG